MHCAQENGTQAEVGLAVIDEAAADRLRRRVARFRRAGLFSGCGDNVVIERATSADDLREAYALVHRVFLEQGFINPQMGGLRLRVFEALPEMATFVAKIEGKVIAVTSVVPDSIDLGLPSDKCFLPELDSLRTAGRRISEITNLAVDPEYRNTPVFFELTRCCFAHAMAHGCDDLFIAISPEHARFFEQVLLFEPMGEQRSYSAEIEDIVEGKRLNLQGLEERAIARDAVLREEALLHDFFYRQNVYHRKVRTWAELARRTFLTPALLADLFVSSSQFLARCDDQEIWSIRRRWGSDLFAKIWPPKSWWQKVATIAQGQFQRRMPSLVQVFRGIRAASF